MVFILSYFFTNHFQQSLSCHSATTGELQSPLATTTHQLQLPSNQPSAASACPRHSPSWQWFAHFCCEVLPTEHLSPTNLGKLQALTKSNTLACSFKLLLVDLIFTKTGSMFLVMLSTNQMFSSLMLFLVKECVMVKLLLLLLVEKQLHSMGSTSISMY